ncbi:MAG: beta-lactamase family protein [Acidobacteriia bacterium]|jgi:CubicO group peptidase (beta-lactamase class C family)|nr:beta-lactamase family protein [Terriglobia bacterium]
MQRKKGVATMSFGIRLQASIWTIGLILPFALPTPQAAQSSGLHPETIRAIESVISSEQQRQNIPGISLAVAVNGTLRYAQGFGKADLENNVPVTLETRFRTASIAKPMTAVAVMQLAEQGRLDLDAEIQKYCPAYPKKSWPVTVRHLLAHLGGVRHYQRPGEASGTEHFFTLQDALRLFADDPLLHEPGARYTYTTYGYVLLGCAIEGASGESYEEYMRRHVWEPAGMTHTRSDDHFELIPNRARGYARLDEATYNRLPPHQKSRTRAGQLINATLHDTSMKVPGGGLLSTAADLVRFGLAVLEGRLVQPQTRDAMWTRQKTSDGNGTGYGLGWAIGTLPSNGAPVVSHSGGQAGTAALLVIVPEQKTVIAIMTNLQGANTATMVNRVLHSLAREAHTEAPSGYGGATSPLPNRRQQVLPE